MESPGAPVAFEDVAVYFSAGEWMMLEERQKELYREVMLENYHTLRSLDLATVKPEIIWKIRNEESPCAVGEPDQLCEGPPGASGLYSHPPSEDSKGLQPDAGERLKVTLLHLVQPTKDARLRRPRPPLQAPRRRVRTPGPRERHYICTDCGKTFSLWKSLIQHFKSHAAVKPFACADCGKKFSHRTNLALHQRSHKRPKPHERPVCAKSFPQESSLPGPRRMHEGRCGRDLTGWHPCIHTTEQPFPCSKCCNDPSKPEAQAKGLQNGVHSALWGKSEEREEDASQDSKPLRVRAVGERNASDARGSDQNPDILTLQITCKEEDTEMECGLHYPQGLQGVNTSRGRGHNMLEYSELQAQPWTLPDLCRSSQAERPHIKSECSKDFPLSLELNAGQETDAAHAGSVSGENSSPAPTGGELASRETALNYPERDTGPNPEVLYKCTECGEVFSCRSQILTHLRSHIEERSSVQTFRERTPSGGYQCSQCGKSFLRKELLRKHRRVHMEERPFTCTECGKAFKDRGQLRRHLRSHTGERPFPCDICGKCYSDASVLKRHHKVHTAEKPPICREGGQSVNEPADCSKNHEDPSRTLSEHVGGSVQNGELIIWPRVHVVQELSANSPSLLSVDTVGHRIPHDSKPEAQGKGLQHGVRSVPWDDGGEDASQDSKPLRAWAVGECSASDTRGSCQNTDCLTLQITCKEEALDTEMEYGLQLPQGLQGVNTSCRRGQNVKAQPWALPGLCHSSQASHQAERPHIKRECSEDFPVSLELNAGQETPTSCVGSVSGESAHDSSPAPTGDELPSGETILNYPKRDTGPNCEVLYKCTECGEVFSCRSQILTHLRSHIEERSSVQTFRERTPSGEIIYRCTQCDKSFLRKELLRKHRRVHMEERPFTCTECGKAFKDRGQLRRHLRSHTGERPFPCDICGKCYSDASVLKRHHKVHTAEKPPICREGGQSVNEPADCSKNHEDPSRTLSEHVGGSVQNGELIIWPRVHVVQELRANSPSLLSVDTVGHRIPHDSKPEAQGKGLQHGVRSVPWDDGGEDASQDSKPLRAWAVGECSASDTRGSCQNTDCLTLQITCKEEALDTEMEYGLQLPQGLQGVNTSCRRGQNVQAQPWALPGLCHSSQASHQAERPHIKRECSEDFPVSLELNAGQETPTSCVGSVSGESAHDSSPAPTGDELPSGETILNYPKRDTGPNCEVLYKCTECGEVFSCRSQILTHLRSHIEERSSVQTFQERTPSGEIIYRCTQCDKSFLRKELLRKHRRVHMEERPFTCTECEKAFKDRGQLRRHLRSHTGERPFPCDICGKCYSDASVLKRHHKVHTAEKPPICREGGQSVNEPADCSKNHEDPSRTLSEHVGGSVQNGELIIWPRVHVVQELSANSPSLLSVDAVGHRIPHDSKPEAQGKGLQHGVRSVPWDDGGECLEDTSQDSKPLRVWVVEDACGSYQDTDLVTPQITCKEEETEIECGLLLPQGLQGVNASGGQDVQPWTLSHSSQDSHQAERPHIKRKCSEDFPVSLEFDAACVSGESAHDSSLASAGEELASGTVSGETNLNFTTDDTGPNPEVLYKCTECGEVFSCRSQILTHLRSHIEERSSVQTFQERTPSGEIIYRCTQCDKSFLRKEQLRKHRRVHMEERPFTCTECEKAFKEPGQLRRHLRTHTGERPFQCKDCGKTFNDSSILSRHRKIHVKKKFPCVKCGEQFAEVPALLAHYKVHGFLQQE